MFTKLLLYNCSENIMCGALLAVGGAILTSLLCCQYGLVQLQSSCLLSPVKKRQNEDAHPCKKTEIL